MQASIVFTPELLGSLGCHSLDTRILGYRPAHTTYQGQLNSYLPCASIVMLLADAATAKAQQAEQQAKARFVPPRLLADDDTNKACKDQAMDDVQKHVAAAAAADTEATTVKAAKAKKSAAGKW
jgi:hypothetical protein